MKHIVDYEGIINIPENSKVIFQEFVLDRHQKAKKSVEVHGKLSRIIKDNEGLNRDEIEQYYPEVEEDNYVILSVYPYYRLVLIIGTSQTGMPIYKTIHTNKYFLHAGLQKIQYEPGIQVSYGTPQTILGYESYQIGQKFKK